MAMAKWFLSAAVIFAALGGDSGADSGADELQVPTTQATTEDTERDRFWDSPSMVSARLFMDEYFATSVEVTPEEAEEFWAELEAMSAAELRFWLAKFSHERQGRARIAAANEKTRQYKLGVARAARRRRERINEEFNHSARQAARLAQTRAEKSFDRTSRYRPRHHSRYPAPQIFFWFR